MERVPSSSKAGCHCAVGGQLLGKLSKVPSIFGYGMGSHIKTKRQREKRRMGRNYPGVFSFHLLFGVVSGIQVHGGAENTIIKERRPKECWPLCSILNLLILPTKKRTPSRSPLFLFSGEIPLFVAGLFLLSPRVDILAGGYAKDPLKCPAEGGIAGVASLFSNSFYG